MARYRYVLTIHEDEVDIIRDDNDGTISIYLEGECHPHQVEDADSQGDFQGDLLWESFGHEFTGFDDEDQEIVLGD